MFPFCTDVTVVVIVNVSVRLLLTLLSAVTKPDIPSNGGVRKFVVSRSNLNKEGGGLNPNNFKVTLGTTRLSCILLVIPQRNID